MFIIALMIVIAVLAMFMMIRARMVVSKSETEGEESWGWELTPFQKLDFLIDDVVKGLLDSNIIGEGSSGAVYQVETKTGLPIVVKKLWPELKDRVNSERVFFIAEVRTLGSIRQKNIVRLLGYCCRRRSGAWLLIFDYISNGSLDSLLHDSKVHLEWDSRYKIALSAAQGLAYLHHDYDTLIIHRDVKSNNILIGR